jgi:hypothetical protein
MPFPFAPVPIPFVSGARQDLGVIAQPNPSQLRQANNILFTKRGHVTGRPGAKSRDVPIQLAPGVALASSLDNLVSPLTPSGIVATGFQATNKSDIDTPLTCYQGQSYFMRDPSLWEYAGVHWSLRQTKSAALETHDPSGTSSSLRGTSIPIGKDVVGVLTTVGTSTGIPYLTPTGEVKWVASGVPSGTFDNPGRTITVASNNSLFWKFGTTIYGMFTTGAGPTTSAEISLATMSAGGGLDVCTDGTNFYVAHGGGAGPGTSNVVKIGPTGTVLQTLSLTWAAGNMSQGPGMSICYNGFTGRLGVAAIQGITGVVATKIITLPGGVMTDAGIELTLTGTAGIGGNAESICCGVTHNAKMSVLFNLAPIRWDTGAVSASTTGTTYIGGRLFTAATETAITQLTGAVNSFGFGQTWDPLFAGQVIAGRTLVGFMHGYEITNRANQWVVMDFTSLYTSATTAERTVVACGALNGFERCVPSSVYSDGTQIAFGVSEGLIFAGIPDATPSSGTGNVALIRRAATRRITLELQGVQAAHVHDTTLLSGQLMHVFDGNKIRPHHFPEETPYIFNGGNGFVYTSAGGALVAGSYSYQATWEAVDARGHTVRSGASAIITVPGVTLNQQVTLHITKPQLWNNSSASEFVRVRLWATQTNPPNNAPKYLAAETVTSTPGIGFEVVMVHTTVATGVEEQLYETIDTLADMRAPGADRGIAVVAERAWCADQTKLYVSKIIRPNLGLSWNTEGPHVLQLPATLGTIQGLAAVNQALVVMCSRGAALVTGPGVDDTGVGPGWVLQIIDGVPGMGTSSPRSLTATPSGVAFQAQDGNIWMVNASGQAAPMSRAVRDNSIVNQVGGIDVINVTSTETTNALIIAQGKNHDPNTGFISNLRVLDLEAGQWATWTFPNFTPRNGLFLASIGGALWMQLTDPGGVVSIDGPQGSDETTPGVFSSFESTIETGTLRPSNPVVHGWGRLRSVIIDEVRNTSSTQVDYIMQVFADGNDRLLLDKTKTTNPNDTATFPGGGDGALEFRTSVQRCAYARVLLTITPAIFDLEGLVLWVSNTGETSPSNNRI